jgi:hypothetical protein
MQDDASRKHEGRAAGKKSRRLFPERQEMQNKTLSVIKKWQWLWRFGPDDPANQRPAQANADCCFPARYSASDNVYQIHP